MSILGNLAGALLSGDADPKKLLLKVAQEFLLGNDQTQGLKQLKQNFDQAGLSDIVNSWIGKGANLSVQPEQIHSALGNDTIQKIASMAGFDTTQITSLLSEIMPDMVDRLTPEGLVSLEN